MLVRRALVLKFQRLSVVSALHWHRAYTTEHQEQGEAGNSPKPCCHAKQNTPPPEPIQLPNPQKWEFWSDRPSWKAASANTFRCLVGCSLGDFSTLFLLQHYAPGIGMAMQMGLSMVAGISTSLGLETVALRLTEKMSWKASANMAWKMSMVSMLSMELAENAADLYLTGGVLAPESGAWWAALAVSLAAGYLTPLPYNYYQLRRYRKSCH